MIKRQFGYVKARFRGLMKNTAQLTTLFALSNLWMMRNGYWLRDRCGCMRGKPLLQGETMSKEQEKSDF